jgi:hypothetical protein
VAGAGSEHVPRGFRGTPHPLASGSSSMPALATGAHENTPPPALLCSRAPCPLPAPLNFRWLRPVFLLPRPVLFVALLHAAPANAAAPCFHPAVHTRMTGAGWK